MRFLDEFICFFMMATRGPSKNTLLFFFLFNNILMIMFAVQTFFKGNNSYTQLNISVMCIFYYYHFAKKKSLSIRALKMIAKKSKQLSENCHSSHNDLPFFVLILNFLHRLLRRPIIYSIKTLNNLNLQNNFIVHLFLSVIFKIEMLNLYILT